MDAPESPGTPAVRALVAHPVIATYVALETGRLSVIVEEAAGVAG